MIWPQGAASEVHHNHYFSYNNVPDAKAVYSIFDRQTCIFVTQKHGAVIFKEYFKLLN